MPNDDLDYSQDQSGLSPEALRVTRQAYQSLGKGGQSFSPAPYQPYKPTAEGLLNATGPLGHMVVCDSAVTERRQALYWVNKGQKYLFRALNAFIVSGGRPSIVFAGRRRDATRAVVLWIIELMRIALAVAHMPAGLILFSICAS
jgi:hypothetical protein